MLKRTKSPITIAIDGSHFDRLKIENGQFRYLVDLVTGLARLESSYHFVLCGTLPKAPDIIQSIPGFNRWDYCSRPVYEGRGYYYRTLLAYRSALRKYRVNLFHSLSGFVPIELWSTIVATRLDIMYELFPEYEEARNARIYRLERWLTQHMTRRVIAISETTARDVSSRWKIPRDRIDVVMLGSDFSLKVGSERQIKERYLLTQFNLEPRKNLSGLLEAWPSIVKAHPDLKLVCYGKTAWSADRQIGFDKQIARLGIGSSVIVTGFVDDSALCGLYEGAELFVSPTLYEGFGLPILEAMARGCCVVARNQSAMAEIVGDSGILTETANPEILAKAICDIMSAPERRKQLALEGQKRSQTFSIDRMAQETILSYDRALSRHP